MREIVSALCDPGLTNGQGQGQQNGSSGSNQSGKKSSSHPSPQNGVGVSSPIDSILQRVTIIGGIVAFRNLLYEAVNDVLKQRMPFLMNALTDLYDVSTDDVKTVGSFAAVRLAKLHAASNASSLRTEIHTYSRLSVKYARPRDREPTLIKV